MTKTPEAQLRALLQRFTPSIRLLVRDARMALRSLIPGATQLVYDNANALAIGFGASERRSDIIVSLAVYARGVNLYFMYGAALEDPHRLLLGQGNQGRFLRLESVEMLTRPEVRALLAAAVEDSETPFPKTGDGPVVIKSVSARRRPSRTSTMSRMSRAGSQSRRPDS